MLEKYLWFIYSLTAAVLWGIHYATAGQLSKTMPASLISLGYLIFVAVAALLFMFLFFRDLMDINQLQSYLTLTTLWQLGLMVLTGCLSNFLVFTAIADSTATKASIIEITYPFFVALFGVLMYREQELNIQVMIGGLLILLGSVIIIKS